MNYIKSVVPAVITAIVVVLIGFGMYHPSSVNRVEQTVVKGSTPEVSSPYLIVNGITHWYSKMNMVSSVTGTTTPCQFQSPSATSSLQFASFAVTVATSSATTWTIATSTTQYATTTLVATIPVAAGATKETFFDPSTVAGGNAPMLPNTWVVFGVAGGLGAGINGVVVSGVCQAEFTQLL